MQNSRYLTKSKVLAKYRLLEKAYTWLIRKPVEEMNNAELVKAVDYYVEICIEEIDNYENDQKNYELSDIKANITTASKYIVACCKCLHDRDARYCNKSGVAEKYKSLQKAFNSLKK